MTIGILLAALVFLSGAGLLIAWPLLKGQPRLFVEPAPPKEEFNERDGLLDALSEVETDYQTGKISLEDYTRQKQTFQLRYLKTIEK
ncbi:MAG: hypothetical protein OEW12_02810 [Deltaproteobacteria bacterium]|nr:hypothetical protein [Deltaproteobacteria bacterium]